MPRKLKVVKAPEIEYFWRSGYVPPKGIAAVSVKEALDALPEPAPEALFEASKDASHILHEEIWSKGDQEWARVGRIEHCRKIISNLVEIISVGGREIETRVVEFVRLGSEGRWSRIEDVISDPEMRDAHLAAIQRLQDEAAAKLARFRELIRSS